MQDDSFFISMKKLSLGPGITNSSVYPYLLSLLNSKVLPYMDTCIDFLKEKTLPCLGGSDPEKKMKCAQLGSKHFISHLFSFVEYSLLSDGNIDFATLRHSKLKTYKENLFLLKENMLLRKSSIKELLEHVINVLEKKSNHTSYEVLVDVLKRLKFVQIKVKYLNMKHKEKVEGAIALLKNNQAKKANVLLATFLRHYKKKSLPRTEYVWGWKLGERLKKSSKCQFITEKEKLEKYKCNISKDGAGLIHTGKSKTNVYSNLRFFTSRITRTTYKIKQDIYGLKKKNIINLINSLQKKYGSLVNFESDNESIFGTFYFPLKTDSFSKLSLTVAKEKVSLLISSKKYQTIAMSELKKVISRESVIVDSILDGI